MRTKTLRPSRPMPFKLWLGIPLVAAIIMLLRDPTHLDFRIERLFYTAGEGFLGKQYGYLFETLLHDRVKQAVIAFAVFALAGWLGSFFLKRLRPLRRTLGYVVLSLAVCTSIVMPLKVLTGVHCPWSLEAFGGHEVYTPLLASRAPTDKPGLCWPGGHASAGFSLLALFFALRDRKPRLAVTALWGALLLGSVLSLGRMMQGAHFLSHNLWTLLFDWTICLLLYRLMLFRRGPAPLEAPRPMATRLVPRQIE